MGDLTISGLDDAFLSRLNESARESGRTPEEEARELLTTTLISRMPRGADDNLAAFIRRRVAPHGGFDIPAVPREEAPEPPDLR